MAANSIPAQPDGTMHQGAKHARRSIQNLFRAGGSSYWLSPTTTYANSPLKVYYAPHRTAGMVQAALARSPHSTRREWGLDPSSAPSPALRARACSSTRSGGQRRAWTPASPWPGSTAAVQAPPSIQGPARCSVAKPCSHFFARGVQETLLEALAKNIQDSLEKLLAQSVPDFACCFCARHLCERNAKILVACRGSTLYSHELPSRRLCPRHWIDIPSADTSVTISSRRTCHGRRTLSGITCPKRGKM